MKPYKDYEILKYSNNTTFKTNDNVITEYELAVYVNSKPLVTLLCTPESLKELAVGFLHSEGIIDSLSDIKDVKIDRERGKVFIETNGENSFSYSGDYLFAHKAITTACGKGRTVSYNIVEPPFKISDLTKVNPPDILRLMNSFSKMSELFVLTGGVHSCALSTNEEILYFEEDIGRHNALDKIFGHAMLESIPLDDKYILTTGRISSEIIQKALKRKIKVIVSRSAPTNLAIDLAKQSNISLIGFARGQSLNIYN